MAVTTAEVRGFLRDFAGYNILLANVQFTDAEIATAMRFAISEYNAMAPITSYTDVNFPNDWLLLLGITAHLMMSETFLQLRNQASYNDGDIQSIGIDDKYPQYTKLAQDIKADWKTAAQRFKQQVNMESGYGSLSSGYRYIYPGARTRR